MKRGKKKKSIKCKIRASYSKTSYTFTRDLCLYIHIYICFWCGISMFTCGSGFLSFFIEIIISEVVVLFPMEFLRRTFLFVFGFSLAWGYWEVNHIMYRSFLLRTWLCSCQPGFVSSYLCTSSFLHYEWYQRYLHRLGYHNL